MHPRRAPGLAGWHDAVGRALGLVGAQEPAGEPIGKHAA
jgi:hypothetical protein